MPIVEEASHPLWLEKRLLHELHQRPVESGLRQVHDPGEDLRNKTAPDHRAGLRDGPSFRREALEAREDGVLDGRRHG